MRLTTAGSEQAGCAKNSAEGGLTQNAVAHCRGSPTALCPYSPTSIIRIQRYRSRIDCPILSLPGRQKKIRHLGRIADFDRSFALLAPTVSSIKLVPPPLFQAELRADVPAVDALRNLCSACGLLNLCLPTGLKESDMHQLDKIIGRRSRVQREEQLNRPGAPI